MANTLQDEAVKILDLAGISDRRVMSCDPGPTPSTKDDTCTIEEQNLSKTSDEDRIVSRTLSFDDIFSLANARNLERKTLQNPETQNYFFKISPDAVFFRKGSNSGSDLGDGGLLFRSKGKAQWEKVDFEKIEKSPDLKAKIVPLLKKVVESRTEYDQFNEESVRADYAYAQEKAILWLTHLVKNPKEDPDLIRIFIKAFPDMSVSAAETIFYRLQVEGGNVIQSLESALVAMKAGSDKDKKKMAGRMLRTIKPSVSPDDWSAEEGWRPSPYFGGTGGVYIPFSGNEPAGSYSGADLGLLVCHGPAFKCAQGEGLRVGFAGTAGKMINGYGFYDFGGQFLIGNQNFLGFVEGGVKWYPNGRFEDTEDLSPCVGGGLWLTPLKEIPLSMLFSAKVDLRLPEYGGVVLGLGSKRVWW